MTNYEIMKLKDGIINSKNKIKTLTEYLNEHPDDLGVQLSLSNHKTRLKELELELSIIKKNNDSTVLNEEINIHLSGESIKDNAIYSHLLINFIEIYEEIISNISAALRYGSKNMMNYINADFKRETSHLVKTSPGSFIISFSPIVHEDNQSTLKPSLNKQSFDKLCELINFGESIEEIMNQKDIIGFSSLLKYKTLIRLLDENKLDISINESNLEPKVEIKYEKVHKIYNCLKSFNEEKIETEEIEKEGIIYYINTDNKKCGIKFFDEKLEKYIKIPSIKYPAELKQNIKDNVDLEVKVILEKTIKTNINKENSNPTYKLIRIE